jgi:hypothetical protein
MPLIQILDTISEKTVTADTHWLNKRDNFASRNPGVILDFVIVGLVAIVVIGIYVNKKIKASK